jgi:hypothetical protein
MSTPRNSELLRKAVEGMNRDLHTAIASVSQETEARRARTEPLTARALTLNAEVQRHERAGVRVASPAASLSAQRAQLLEQFIVEQTDAMKSLERLARVGSTTAVRAVELLSKLADLMAADEAQSDAEAGAAEQDAAAAAEERRARSHAPRLGNRSV